jgi:hypothetical protein
MKADDIEAEIGVVLRELVPDHRPLPGLAERVEGRARRRRVRQRVVAGLGAVAAVAVVGGLGANVIPGHRGGVPAVTSQDPPPPIATNRVHQVITPSVLPTSGGEIALITANPTSTQFMGGVSGKVDRWTGSSWTPYRNFSGSLDFWGGAGQLYKLDEDFGVRAIGLQTQAHGYGTVLWVRATGLPPGFYRFTQDGVRAHDAGGILEIRANGPAAPQLRPTAPAILGVGNILAGKATELRPSPTVLDDQGKNDVGSLQGPATIERFDGTSWQPVTSVPANDHPASTVGNVNEFVVQLPPLPAGVYRMTRDTTKAGAITGVFWVLQPL